MDIVGDSVNSTTDLSRYHLLFCSPEKKKRYLFNIERELEMIIAHSNNNNNNVS